MLSKEEECVRIVEELRRSDKLIGDDMVPYGITCDPVMINRILAVKPKGPWPLTLGPYTFSLDECNDALIDPPCGELSEKEMDRLVVAWLTHRGVEPYLLINAASGTVSPDHPRRQETIDNFQAILDNAEAD